MFYIIFILNSFYLRSLCMLNKLKWKFTRFMYGRYGVDQLYKASVLLFIVLQVLQVFVQNFFLNVLIFALIFWTFYRVFSKNIYARQKENQIFLKFTRAIKSKGKLFVRRLKDIDSYRYRKCSACNTTLRLPKKRGKHKARCPKCGHLLEVKIWI